VPDGDQCRKIYTFEQGRKGGDDEVDDCDSIGDEGHVKQNGERTNIFKKYGNKLDFDTYFKSLCEQVSD
jgi:hypothetical protein